MNSDVQAENAARDLLRGAAEGVHGRADLFALVQVGAARRRRRRRVAAGGVLSVIAVVGAVTAVLQELPGTSDAVAIAGSVPARPLACPSTAPSQVDSTRPGVTGHLVPGTPTAGLACSYDYPKQLDGGTAPTGVSGSLPLTGSRLNDVVAALRQPLARYPDRCPAQAEQQKLYLDFRYPQGPDVTVLISLDCRDLTNGPLSGTFNAEGTLPAAVAALAGPQS